ncbi:MAG TPA: hypothetical protein VFZ59_20140 [Verrucomicrobiae bacterium]|nr:hypothetical protein [Verrucomicrobiae bacterium]
MLNATSKTRRRWFGGICLLTAIAMLVVGQTLLKDRLQPLTFAAYWSVCFIVTGVAALVAWVDASRVRAEQRDAQRALIESTLREIERQKRDPKG